jgi:hypothetical protein
MKYFYFSFNGYLITKLACGSKYKSAIIFIASKCFTEVKILKFGAFENQSRLRWYNILFGMEKIGCLNELWL